jgi:hypothetical protein
VRRGEQVAPPQRAAAASADGPGEPLPHILILLGRWEGFTAARGEVDGGRLTEAVTRILAEGASAGLDLVMTGRISALTGGTMMLRLPDRDDVSMVGPRPPPLSGFWPAPAATTWPRSPRPGRQEAGLHCRRPGEIRPQLGAAGHGPVTPGRGHRPGDLASAPPFRALDGRPGVAAVFTGRDLTAEELTTALSGLAGPAVIMIDDAEGVRDCGASDALRTLVAYGGDQGRALILGGNAEDLCSGFGGCPVGARKARRGRALLRTGDGTPEPSPSRWAEPARMGSLAEPTASDPAPNLGA